MNKEYDILPKINRSDLIKAKKYPQLFLPLFITDDMYNNHHEIMPKLNTSQQTFLTFYLMDGSMRGSYGFLQLIYYGYGEYVYEKPFSEIIKTWGAVKISEIIERTRSLYKKYKDKVEKVKTEEELSYLCSEITDFEGLDDEYIRISDDDEKKIKEYIENNLNEFAIIDESNSQISYIDEEIKEIEERVRMFEEIEIIEKYIEDNISKFTINDENNTFVINASEIFGKNNTVTTDSVSKEINGKWITIKIKKN